MFLNSDPLGADVKCVRWTDNVAAGAGSRARSECMPLVRPAETLEHAPALAVPLQRRVARAAVTGPRAERVAETAGSYGTSRLDPVLRLTPRAMTSVVVLPTYNEIGNIGSILDSLMRADPSVDVLVVDDASPDGTARAARAFAAEHPGRIHVIDGAHKSGLGVAYRAGFAWALERGYQVIVQMDADGSHPPDRLPAMLDLIEAGRADMVVGSRYVPGGGTRGWPWRRRMLSRFANFYARTLLGLDQRDVTGAFRAWSREALLATAPDVTTTIGYGFMVEMAAMAYGHGLRCAEIPIIFVDRIHGISKMTAGIGIEAMFAVWRLRPRSHRSFRSLRGECQPDLQVSGL